MQWIHACSSKITSNPEDMMLLTNRTNSPWDGNRNSTLNRAVKAMTKRSTFLLDRNQSVTIQGVKLAQVRLLPWSIDLGGWRHTHHPQGTARLQLGKREVSQKNLNANFCNIENRAGQTWTLEKEKSFNMLKLSLLEKEAWVWKWRDKIANLVFREKRVLMC